MQKPVSELATLPEDELVQLIARAPLLLTLNGEPRFVAQSISDFEAMVRRLRHLEHQRLPSSTGDSRTLAKVIPLRPTTA